MNFLGTLYIDLRVVAENFAYINAKTGDSCEVAAVVKANAYGCGVAAVAPVLQQAGAKSFFVATLPEALELRTIIGQAPTIGTLNGFDDQNASIYKSEKVTAVINSLEEAKAFMAMRDDMPQPILHIDTAMNRLGVPQADLDQFPDLNPSIVMSHFASADEDTDLNNHQYEAFKKIAVRFPKAKKSLSNSFGVFRSDQYHFDIARPGMALYGLNPTPGENNPMQGVVKLSVPILQTRLALKNETAGYGATYRFEKETPLAIVPLGYADGFFRALSNKGTLYWNGIACPIRGRVSMDLTIVDLSNIPENQRPHRGDMLEVIGENQSADDLAEACDTIGYEVLTSLSRRYTRQYSD